MNKALIESILTGIDNLPYWTGLDRFREQQLAEAAWLLDDWEQVQEEYECYDHLSRNE